HQVITQCNWTLVRDEQGTPKSVLVIGTDITEKKALEEQFLRAQRMESIGTLASGMAHDLNNVLSPIMLAVRLLSMKYEDKESQRLLAMLRKSAERGAGLVRQVLSYASGAEGERITLQPSHLIKEIARILNDTFPKSIKIKLTLPSNLWNISGDPTQIYQVIMNLAVNARDAMPDGGRLMIDAANESVDEDFARLHLDAKPGPHVVITISDTGEGIAPEIISKIFDPFFTTKPLGYGTGLGLSTVAGIVKGHGGFIKVQSEVGSGTTFKIYLPAQAHGQPKVSGELSLPLPKGQGEKILVIDDEPEVLKMTEEALKAYGYEVTALSQGSDAAEICRQGKDQFPIAVVDMMMPEMDGAATMKALRELNPHIKIIAVSGLTEGGKAQEAERAGADAFLPKPFVVDKLLQTIARVLVLTRNQ
ncbi:MAG TPA: ATP-binding protein, partial [Blastocatellia bacterium]|nr:ATP-binding protein [Blastocatellia bacterium]